MNLTETQIKEGMVQRVENGTKSNMAWFFFENSFKVMATIERTDYVFASQDFETARKYFENASIQIARINGAEGV